MQKTKKVETIYKRDVVESITCDICRKEYRYDNWERGDWSALETEVCLTTGNRYPEGGSGEYIEFDICPDCFQNKLIPLLREKFDAHPRITEWDT